MSARAAWSSTLRTFRTTFLTGFMIMFLGLMAVGPFGFLVIPGVLGGVIAGLIMLRRHRFGSQPATSVPPHTVERDLPPTDVINAARIRVAGIGGLGLVAMAVVVGLVFPLTRFALLAGLIGGAIAAWAIVIYRRRRGPIASSEGGLPGARTVFVDSGEQIRGPEGPGLHTRDPELHIAVAKTA
jgi:hypothetical protein